LRPPERGTKVSLKLYLPGAPAAEEASAIVREWSSDPENGFWAEFVDLSGHVRDHIAGLLQRRVRAVPTGPGTPIGAMRPAPTPPPPPRPMADPQVQSEDDRRAFQRYEARFKVAFVNVQDFVLQYAANISAGGVFVQTDDPPELHEVVSISMELPGGGPAVETKAVVVHRVTLEEAQERNTPAGAGVQFVEASDQFRERIERALEFILSQPDPEKA
jgi:uncharacterized protein (TIGR02266 family)